MSVMLATPSFADRPHMDYTKSVCLTQAVLHNADITCHLATLGNSPYLGEVRSALAHVFLATPDATDLFFVDDDVGWPAEKFLEFVQRPEDVVAGVYPKKSDAEAWPCTLETEDDRLIERNGLLRAIMVPAGFLRIKRHVIERLARTSLRYIEPNLEDAIVHSLFEARTVDLEMEELRTTNLDGLSREAAIGHLKQALGLRSGGRAQFWGEDYWFCHRWRELGGELWIDPDINFTHTGSKTYGGNFLGAIGRLRAQGAGSLCASRDAPAGRDLDKRVPEPVAADERWR